MYLAEDDGKRLIRHLTEHFLGTERLRRPYDTIFRGLAAVPPLNRGVRLLRYRW